MCQSSSSQRSCARRPVGQGADVGAKHDAADDGHAAGDAEHLLQGLPPAGEHDRFRLVGVRLGQQPGQFGNQLGVGGTHLHDADAELPVIDRYLQAPSEGDQAQEQQGVSTSAVNTVDPAECRFPAPSNPSAIKPADTAPMKMLARPFTSLIVAARCIPRV